ncbi:hypothetical protein HMPREF1039_0864 [Megasphaera lornae]|uniref:Uncharacterized protein n=1 Tax=Megasphaera lornae TaxID=1000568 RepID=D3LSR0_9FIRM|nr:hypothetical protein HMPREF0889_1433 [Megasphaera genomosp. type_1 str. 28L]EGL39415.1 hypothetical protein HMPREF1039_0864 [Megasphaera lornae]
MYIKNAQQAVARGEDIGVFLTNHNTSVIIKRNCKQMEAIRTDKMTGKIACFIGIKM